MSIVIPVSDAAGLRLALRGLPTVDEVVVVTGETGAEALGFIRAACPGAVLVHPARPGVGTALACGFAACGGDIVVALNSDGSTDPGEIPRYVAALLAGADVVLGSRYREGGRDLTGGRFRRWAARVLIWLVNVLFGVRRTDPGFGYAAFWRDALDRLDLPDPSPGGATAWGDGPEFTALLTVRTAARNLTVAEIGSVAYPRIRRASGADRTTLRHWSRTIRTEYAHRSRAARHAAGSPRAAAVSAGTPGTAGAAGAAGAAGRPAAQPGAATRAWPLAVGGDGHGSTEPLWGPPKRRPTPAGDLWRPGERPAPDGSGESPNDRTAPDRRAGHASRRSRANDNPDGQGWTSGYPSLRRQDIRPRTAQDRRPDPTTAEIRAGRPGRPGRTDAGAAEHPAGWPSRPDTGAGGATAIGSAFSFETPAPGGNEDAGHREVGSRRRRLEGFRQQPNLRVINGEGGGTPRGRGRLRAVPRENPS